MNRPTREDLRLRSWIIQTLIGLLIAGILLVVVFIYLFSTLLP